jgi:diguanylate cyclase (GGDEF)-like protein/PAS domain S-box-containing protein
VGQAHWDDAQYRTMLDTLSEGVMVLDAAGNGVYANAAAEHLTGLPTDTLLRRAPRPDPWRAWFEDGSPTPVAFVPSEVLGDARAQAKGVVIRIHRADDTEVWVSVNVRRMVDDADRLTGAVLSFVDITDLRAATRANAEVEQRFERVFDRLAVGMNIVSLDGRFLRVNPAYCRLVGYEPAELMGMTVYDLCEDSDLDSTKRQYAQLITGETDEFWMDKPLRRKDGSWLFVRVTASMVRDDAGNPLYSVGQVTDITDTRALADRLVHAATHDHLTGLASRSVLTDRLERLLAGARRSDAAAAVLLVDLDGFKSVNDTHGHFAGDAVLIETARRLQSLVRASDLVVRLGGDEFVVVLASLDDAGIAEDIARRIVESIARPIIVGDDTLCITTSVGLVVADGHQSGEALLDDADRALYRAKHSGRGTYAIAFS